MNEAIKLAIEKGGWNDKQAYFYCPLSGEQIDHAVLDPLFWQALGKALGWGDQDGIDDNDYFLGIIDFPEIAEGKAFREVWLYKALQYQKLVLTGGDTEKFWRELLNQ